jgi:hypothetical protein
MTMLLGFMGRIEAIIGAGGSVTRVGNIVLQLTKDKTSATFIASDAL